jgi:hypothetical protein
MRTIQKTLDNFAKQGGIDVPSNVIKDQVKEYYGEILATKNDLKTSACCSFKRSGW